MKTVSDAVRDLADDMRLVVSDLEKMKSLCLLDGPTGNLLTGLKAALAEYEKAEVQ